MNLYKLCLALTFLICTSSCANDYAVEKETANPSRSEAVSPLIWHLRSSLTEKHGLKLLSNLKIHTDRKTELKAVFSMAESYWDRTYALKRELLDLEKELIELAGGYYVHSAETMTRLESIGYTSLEKAETPEMDGALINPYDYQAVNYMLSNADIATKIQQGIRDLYKDLDDDYQFLIEERIKGSSFELSSLDQLEEQLSSLLKLDQQAPYLYKKLQDKPLEEVVNLLGQLQVDLSIAYITLIDHLREKSKTSELVYDKFEVFSSSERPYILLGESYEADIALGTFASQAEFSASVGGRSLKVVDGKAKFKATPSSIGTQSYTATISIKNPLTAEVDVIKKAFKYEVGVPMAAVAADKMNVFYIGVDNPVSFSAAGVSFNDLSVSVEGARARLKATGGKGRYSVLVHEIPPRGTYCSISLTNKKTGKILIKAPFRVKRIPDPMIYLSNRSLGGEISVADMRDQVGLIAILKNFDFDARCQVQSCVIQHIPKGGTAKKYKNIGGRFTGISKQAIEAAQAGDVYLFFDLKGRCPGDKAARKLNSLAFTVR